MHKLFLIITTLMFSTSTLALDCAHPKTQDDLETCKMQAAGKAGEKKKKAEKEAKEVLRRAEPKKVEPINPEDPERDPGALKKSREHRSHGSQKRK